MKDENVKFKLRKLAFAQPSPQTQSKRENASYRTGLEFRVSRSRSDALWSRFASSRVPSHAQGTSFLGSAWGAALLKSWLKQGCTQSEPVQVCFRWALLPIAMLGCSIHNRYF